MVYFNHFTIMQSFTDMFIITKIISKINLPTSFAPPKLKESSLSGIKGLVRPAERFALLLPPPLSTRPDSTTDNRSDQITYS